MLEELQKHPSNIVRSAIDYLQASKAGVKTRRTYEDVFFLFIEHLRSDPSAVVTFPQTSASGQLSQTGKKVFDFLAD